MTSIMNPCDKKFVWVINNFSSLQLQDCYVSVPVLIRDVKWRLFVYPEENNGDHLSLYLQVDFESMPCGWRQYTQFRLTVVNQLSEQFSVKREGRKWFDKKAPEWGWEDMIPLTKLNDINSGFLVNGEVIIVAEVETFEAISTSQVEKISDDSEWTVLDYYSSSEEDKDDVTVVVKGFPVLESQVNQVKEIFEKHPDLASNFNVKNQNLKNVYMGILLDLIKTLSKSPKELTEEDLNLAVSTLSDLTKAGFMLDWLNQKLDKALEKQRVLI
ncbi:PREDICTED: MATH domain and coiled-coil domain-containing protein At3g58280-like [Camelina sativa]|uniref:MATH domain and coiled-coil domain-containing protein At3g58280-like n=1 Tax=Camelina sativa TaxID=90675 RepID=A0ABM0TU38_CAMSA|nr:PREDICTED: MATH domain and coiled-coil domain-containing protein At3g58280-like [Camelina sativa]